MSKKFKAGRRKSQIQPNSLGSKRRRGGKRFTTYGPIEQVELLHADYQCAVCGRTISTPYVGIDGVTRCMICTLERMA